MNRRLLYFACLCLIVLGAMTWVHAQYILPQDTIQQIEEDTAAVPPPRGESTLEDSIEAAPPQITEKDLANMAQTWVKRLLFRGTLETKVIGAYARYQLTAWSEISGSFGPVEARVTVSYLGSTQHAGKKAEWLQAIFQTVESDPQLVEFDLTVPATPNVREVYQAFHRINNGAIREISFSSPDGTVDPDSSDHPVSEGVEQVRLFVGSYESEKFHGVGSGGVDVVVYRSAEIPPVSIIRLGYGNQGLTYTGGDMDAVPRFLPPGVR